MAVVYSAVRTRDQASMAVKVMRKQPMGSQQLMRLRDEIRSLQALRHASIISLQHTYEDDENLLLIMEKADGGELFDRIVEAGSFSEEHASEVTRQLVDAVSFMHSRGVIHRDIKPENILLTSRTSWQIKIYRAASDFFGGSGRLSGDGSSSPTYRSHVANGQATASAKAGPTPTNSGALPALEGAMSPPTSGPLPEPRSAANSVDGDLAACFGRMRATTMCGSPNYMAPEVLYGRPQGYDAKVDVYSCGIVLYVLLSGGLPFYETPHPDLPAIVNGYEGTRVDFPPAAWGTVSEAAKALIRRMCEVDASLRPSATEVKRDAWLQLVPAGAEASADGSNGRGSLRAPHSRLSQTYHETFKQMNAKRSRRSQHSSRVSSTDSSPYSPAVSKVARGGAAAPTTGSPLKFENARESVRSANSFASVEEEDGRMSAASATS